MANEANREDRLKTFGDVGARSEKDKPPASSVPEFRLVESLQTDRPAVGGFTQETSHGNMHFRYLPEDVILPRHQRLGLII